MVYTELEPRRQQFYVAPAMQQSNSAVSAPHRRILLIRATKEYSELIQNTCDISAVSPLDRRE